MGCGPGGRGRKGPVCRLPGGLVCRPSKTRDGSGGCGERGRMEGVLHWRSVRGRDGECLLETTARVERLRPLPEPQDVRWGDELRPDPVFVQPGDARARPEGTESAARRLEGNSESLQDRGTELPECVSPVKAILFITCLG